METVTSRKIEKLNQTQLLLQGSVVLQGTALKAHPVYLAIVLNKDQIVGAVTKFQSCKIMHVYISNHYAVCSDKPFYYLPHRTTTNRPPSGGFDQSIYANMLTHSQ